MGKDINRQFEECVRTGRLKPFQDAKEIAEKELRVANSDLNEALQGLDGSRWKWGTIQAYYVMFHIARALIYKHGYREKSHYCLRIAVEYLYPEIPSQMIEDFQTAKIMRENADYEENFSEIGAKKIVKSAETFLIFAENILTR
jgi:uncharacterized protein (UPF0332 family)